MSEKQLVGPIERTAADFGAVRDRVVNIEYVSRQKVGLGKSRIYEMIRDGEFPCPVQLSKGRVGWRESEIDLWISSRPVIDLRRLKPPVDAAVTKLVHRQPS